MENSGISWTDHTANFWRGCEKVSPGCKFCYAEVIVTGWRGEDVWGRHKDRVVGKNVWSEVRRWSNRAKEAGTQEKCFVMSLGDFFEDHARANEVRPKAWEWMRKHDGLIYQVLTKRPDNIERFLPEFWPLPNVWLGVSVEDSAYEWRIDALRRFEAVVRFISYEPALGPLSPNVDLTGVSWVIYGGESGPDRRPEDKQWARDIRDRCRLEGVAFWHKQSSALKPGQGVELDGELIHEFPGDF